MQARHDQAVLFIESMGILALQSGIQMKLGASLPAGFFDKPLKKPGPISARTLSAGADEVATVKERPTAKHALNPPPAFCPHPSSTPAGSRPVPFRESSSRTSCARGVDAAQP